MRSETIGIVIPAKAGIQKSRNGTDSIPDETFRE